MDAAKFQKRPLMGILRGVTSVELEPLLETVVANGLKTLEITLNTKGALSLIKKAVKLAGHKLFLGAGTVLDKQGLKGALDAGATFIVSPVLVTEVAEYCTKHRIPYFPGALTPQEIYAAWGSGATMVKVFPLKVFGPGYLSEIKGPFDGIKLLACSGVTAENLRTYFAHGADGAAFGSEIFKKEWLDAGDYPSIGKAVKKIVDAHSSCLNS